MVDQQPFYEQEQEWTCGPACMRMVMERVGVKKTEKQLIRLMHTTPIKGTGIREFPALAERFQLNYVVNRNSSIDELVDAYRNGYNIIICYYYKNKQEDHYAVLKEIDDEDIYLLDPWVGPEHRYNLNHFVSIWRTRYEHEKGWFFGVK